MFNKEEKLPSRFLRSSDKYILEIHPFCFYSIFNSNQSHILSQVSCLLSLLGWEEWCPSMLGVGVRFGGWWKVKNGGGVSGYGSTLGGVEFW